MHHRDLSTLSLGILGVGAIGKRSKSVSVGMSALELSSKLSNFLLRLIGSLQVITAPLLSLTDCLPLET